MDLIKLGEELRRIRKDAGMTLEEAAILTGEYRQHLGNIENGRHSISIDRLKSIFGAFGYKIEIEYRISKKEV